MKVAMMVDRMDEMKVERMAESMAAMSVGMMVDH